jgi:hypothetical protein
MFAHFISFHAGIGVTKLIKIAYVQYSYHWTNHRCLRNKVNVFHTEDIIPTILNVFPTWDKYYINNIYCSFPFKPYNIYLFNIFSHDSPGGKRIFIMKTQDQYVVKALCWVIIFVLEMTTCMVIDIGAINNAVQ